MAGLYIHIPFCRRKCAYCDFVSFADRVDFLPYTAALITEMRLYSPLIKEKSFDTVFIGGGTPSLLPAGLISRILDEARECFDVAEDAEITIECNPESIDEIKLNEYKASGVNRLSIGMQSSDDKVLAAIGRIHDKARSLSAYALAENAGFTNINIDIMHGLPLQSMESYLDSVRLASELGAQHISSYSLILEEHTRLYDEVVSGKLALPDEDDTADMQDAGITLLESLGYKRYEISNFAKAGFECRHNINYWNNGDYLGLGVNAHSALYIRDKWVRFRNHETIEEYVKTLGENKLPLAETQEVEREDEMFECIMMGLRKIEGVNRAEFEKRFGIDPVEQFAAAVSAAALDGMMEVTEERMKLTRRGLDFQNEVLLNFM
ncbi:MAG: radical SAM family heme chaperone HemW [Clostridia bacterium]|nr:radical SAM family heme chaperone HemW [Clostridia bacterium]